MIKKYQLKPMEVEAVLWDGTNLNEAKSFVNPVCLVECEIWDDAWKLGKGPVIVNFIILDKHNRETRVNVWNYIVKYSDTEYEVMRMSEFENKFMEVAQKEEVE